MVVRYVVNVIARVRFPVPAMNLEDYIDKLLVNNNIVYLVHKSNQSAEYIAGILNLPYAYLDPKYGLKSFRSNTYIIEDQNEVPNTINKLLIITKFKKTPFIDISGYISEPETTKYKKYVAKNKFIDVIDAIYNKYGPMIMEYRNYIYNIYAL